MDPTNRNTALASAMVEELARCGLRRAVIAPGSRSTPLALAVWRHRAIHATVIVDERSAAFFALGSAHAEGRPAAVLCTSGSAAANLHPAIVEADEAGVPLIALTSDRPPELRGIGAGQTIDQVKLYGSAVRWFCELGTHEADDEGLLHFRSVACRAWAAARGEPRPGPVHLNLSWRDPLGPEPREGDVTASSALALEGGGDRPLTAVAASTPAPDPALLDELAERIAASPRGLIVCGRQPDPALATPVATLAAATGYPVLAEPTSQLRLGSHDRSMIVGAYDPIARLRPQALAPEVVIRFGDMPTSKALRGWLASLDGLRQVVVDPRFGWSEPSRKAETVLRGDGVGLAAGLAERLTGRAPDPAWSSGWLRAARSAEEAITAELDGLDALTEPGVHRAMGGLYADGDLTYTASSMPIRDQEAFLPCGPTQVQFLCNRGANGIDGLISSGLGAAAASGRPTWILVGDLGLYHDMNGLAAMRDVNAPVRIVVLNNGGGGIFEFLPQVEQVDREEFEALFGTPLELEVQRIAALHGIRYARAETPAELGPAVREAPVIVEVPIGRRANVDVHARLLERATQALASDPRSDS